jgi:WD40 repeat protein
MSLAPGTCLGPHRSKAPSAAGAGAGLGEPRSPPGEYGPPGDAFSLPDGRMNMRLRMLSGAVLLGAAVSGCGHGAPAGGSAVPPRPLAMTGGAVTLIGFNADGSRLVSATPRSLTVWNAKKATVVSRRDFGSDLNPLSRALTPDGRLLACNYGKTGVGGNRQSETRLLDLQTGRSVVLAPTVALGGNLATTQDGRMLVRVSVDAARSRLEVQWWSLPSGRRLEAGVIELRCSPSGNMAISPKGDRFAIGTHQRTRDDPFPPDPVGAILICDRATSRVVRTIPMRDIPRAMTFSADGVHLLCGRDDTGQVLVYDVESGKQVGNFGNHAGAVQMMALTRDGTRLATASPRGRAAYVWDVASHTLLKTIELESPPYSLAFDARGTRLAVGTQNGAITIVDISRN